MDWVKRLKILSLGATLVGLLNGCGGGGAGVGTSSTPYTISLTANTTQLALNIANEAPNIGSRYTATLYVDARDSAGRPIPSQGESTFSCAVVNGLDSGVLYYLDGDPEHQTTTTVNGVEITTPNAYRSITLPGNSGSSSFHLLATDTHGPVTVRCAVSEPNTNVQRSAQLTIQVGGAASGKTSQVLLNKVASSFPGYLFVQGVNGINQGLLQASLVDEAGQPVPNPAQNINNVQARIVPSLATTADDSALLRGVNSSGQSVSGSSIHIATYNGQAQFSLVSGNSEGSVVVEVVADRADNNVGNGISEPVYNYASIPIVLSAPSSVTTGLPLAITTAAALPPAQGNINYGALLEASGGTTPYTWSLVSSGLPFGLSLLSSGVITGVPFGSSSGTYSFVAQVTDARGAVLQRSYSIVYTAASVTPAPTLVVSPTTATGAPGNTLNFVITGGTPWYSAVSNNASVATVGAVTSTGGQTRVPVTLVNTGNTTLVVTDSGGQAVTVPVTVTSATGGLSLTITPSVGGTVAIGQSFRMMVTGGTPPYAVNSTNTSIGTVTPASLALSGDLFTFNPLRAGTVRLIVNDSVGTIQTVDMTVTQPGGTVLTALPASVNWTTPPAACTTIYNEFVVYGGVPPYTAYSTSPLVVTIPPTSTTPTAEGYYIFRADAACGAEGTAQLVFRDSVNALVTSTFVIDIEDPTVQTVAALVVNPASTTITDPATPRTFNYVVSGGTSPYAVTTSSPGTSSVSAVTQTGGQWGFTATINANAVGATAETIVFVVTDATNGAAIASMTINP